MSIYVKLLFIAIPSFIVLILIEELFARLKGISINTHEDMISSLSSGMTNTIKDTLKIGIAIISYTWLVDKITIFKIEPLWLAVLIAFIVQDFSGYWMHRLQHRVNLFWNQHIIHHSSEEFNLSCALRQSISTIFRFSAVLMFPAALLGIPASIFAVLAPIHLFMQFWYHTRLIDKMGILEHLIVTPSHHRVHHAVNPEYLDKNYGQIFIIWDKMFGTFQPELKEVPPVYGTLRPVSTWNPIVINFKHVWQIIKDAWRSEKFTDKLKIWFMPTGWRPADIKLKFPLQEVGDPYQQVKYKTNNSKLLINWSWMQHVIAGILMFHFFTLISVQDMFLNYFYAAFLIIHIFSFTATMDNSKYAVLAESLKIVLGFSFIYLNNLSWFNLDGVLVMGICTYLIISFILTCNFYLISFKNKSIISS
tara:strand:- start:158 stop:1417 length:1260 start_codon:yes stop_codon:yes gene_type:complete